MSFFQGASDIRITGGEFNTVKGNYVVYDQSRHHTNVNSSNTRSANMFSSHNKRSVNYNETHQRGTPPLLRPGKDTLNRSGRSEPQEFRIYSPSVHPVMMSPENLSPWTRTENVNDYFQNHGPPPYDALHHSHIQWNNPGAPVTSPRDDEDDEDASDSDLHLVPSKQNTFSRARQLSAPSIESNPKQSIFSRARHLTSPNILSNPKLGASGRSFPSFPPERRVAYMNGSPPGYYFTTNSQDGVDEGGYPPEMQTFATLMQQVQQQVQQEDEEESEESEGESEEDEDEDNPMHLSTNSIAYLSLNEELRPALSRVKSDPQLSVGTAPTSVNSLYMEPRHAESTQALPQRLLEPFSWQTSPHESSQILPRPLQPFVNKSASTQSETESSLNLGTAEKEIWENFRATTCWVTAEDALEHMRGKVSHISELFRRWKIQESEYAVYAGFDESLIQAGFGYLQQIHVFVSVEVDATSCLLPELGHILSPFSSILFTESSSYYIPVYKDDSTPWEFDELVHFTASKFSGGGVGGASARMLPSVISLSQSSNAPSGSAPFSQGGTGNDDGEKSRKESSDKGKERDSRGHDKPDKDAGGKDDKGPSENQETLLRGSGATAGSAEIFFDIISEIYPMQDKLNAFQTLTMQGSLTIQTTAQDEDEFAKRHIQFTELAFGALPMGAAYKQIYVRVIVDSQQKNAGVKGIKPKRTPAFEKEAKESSSTKKSQTHNVNGSLTIGMHPQGTIGGSLASTNEEATGSERKRNTSRITQQSKLGVVWWGFYVNDPYEQDGGIEISEDDLPTVNFEFVGDSDMPAPPPERTDIEITSCWSLITAGSQSSSRDSQNAPEHANSGAYSPTWIRKILNRSKLSGGTQSASYSNLCQIVAFETTETISSKLPKRSDYRATVHVIPGITDSDYSSHFTAVRRKTADSVKVTPEVRWGKDFVDSDDLLQLSTLKLPTLTKVKISDSCTQMLDSSPSSSKSH